MTQHRVHLIFREMDGSQIKDLASADHVWIQSTPTSKAVAREIWENKEYKNPWSGITVCGDEECSHEQAIDFLSAINEHHCEWSFKHAWDTIEVWLPPEWDVALIDLQRQFENTISIVFTNNKTYVIKKSE